MSDRILTMARAWLKTVPGFKDKALMAEIDRGEHDQGPRILGFVAGYRNAENSRRFIGEDVD